MMDKKRRDAARDALDRIWAEQVDRTAAAEKEAEDKYQLMKGGRCEPEKVIAAQMRADREVAKLHHMEMQDLPTDTLDVIEERLRDSGGSIMWNLENLIGRLDDSFNGLYTNLSGIASRIGK